MKSCGDQGSPLHKTQNWFQTSLFVRGAHSALFFQLNYFSIECHNDFDIDCSTKKMALQTQTSFKAEIKDHMPSCLTTQDLFRRNPMTYKIFIIHFFDFYSLLLYWREKNWINSHLQWTKEAFFMFIQSFNHNDESKNFYYTAIVNWYSHFTQVTKFRCWGSMSLWDGQMHRVTFL